MAFSPSPTRIVSLICAYTTPISHLSGNFKEEKLHLCAPLRINTARDCYATCLDRAGVATKKISNMMVHSSVAVTEDYLGGMNYKELFDVNSVLF